MSTSRRLRFLGGVMFLLLLAGCQPPPPAEEGKDRDGGKPPAGSETNSSDADLDGPRLRVSGPYRHESLTVFLVHSQKQDESNFLTLDEGLKDGLVKVTELDQEQVG